MLGIWIGVGAGVIVLLMIFISHIYDTPQTVHDKTPADYGIDFDEIRFPTKNDCSLYGWWIPEKWDNWRELPTIILVHGWSRNVGRMLPYIRNMHGQGFNLLAFDARHHGNSDSDGFGAMPKFAEDIISAIDYLTESGEITTGKIGVLGLSIGGAGAIYAASLDKRIKAMVIVGAFSHPEEVMLVEFRRRKIPRFPFAWLAFRYMEFRIGARFDDIAPVNNIRLIKGNLLLVHGSDDQTVPVEQAEHMYSLSNPERTKFWLQEGRGHSDCHKEDGFWERVIGFFQNIFGN